MFEMFVDRRDIRARRESRVLDGETEFCVHMSKCGGLRRLQLSGSDIHESRELNKMSNSSKK